MVKRSSASFIDRMLSPVGIVVLIFVVLLLSVGTYFYARKGLFVGTFKSLSKKTAKVTPTPTPTPRPIPHGKIPFRITAGNAKGPKFTEGFLEPYDPKPGVTQFVRVGATNTEPITSVTATIKTDSGSEVIPLKLISGTDMKGEWEGSWVVKGTYLYTYELHLKAVSSNGTKTNELMLR